MQKLKTIRDALVAHDFDIDCSDDFVAFRHDNGNYMVPVHHDDETFFQLVFPNFWLLEDANARVKALDAAGAVNAVTKMVKIIPTESHAGPNMSASIELRLPSATDFGALVPDLLQSIFAARKLFEMRMMLGGVPSSVSSALRQALDLSGADDDHGIDGIDLAP